MHVFLSPHLDDAVLSCGGMIHQLTQRGKPVLIITVMAGDPPDPLPNTPLIRDLHQRWAVGTNPMPARRAEDSDAATLLGATIEHLDFSDCPYRTDDNGTPLYPTNDDLFGDVHPDDPVLQATLPIPTHTTTLYAPLSAGGHVDHVVVCRLAQQLQVALLFYEEYPYSANSQEAIRISSGSGRQQHGTIAVDTARQRIAKPLSSFIIELDQTNMQHKIDAIACYTSQISTFWDNTPHMAERVRDYANTIAPMGAERLWKYKETV